MFEGLLTAAFPVLFGAVLAVGRASLRRRGVDMAGRPPIGKGLFFLGKFALAIPWAAVVLKGLGVDLSPIRVPPVLGWISLVLWVSGWGLMLAGRIGLGGSFRVGCPKEETNLRTGGVYRYTRNPMYVGLDTTLLAAALYTLNPLVLMIGMGVAAVHHRIILAEEECLRKMCGQEYEEYCRKVGRYL